MAIPLISLTLGELAMPTPAPVVEAGIAALHEGQTHYGPTDGLYDLRAAIASHYSQTQPGLGPEHVLITPGVRPAVFNLLTNLLRPGDEVILPSPYWFAFPDLIAQAGGVVRELPTLRGDNYAITRRQLQRLINHNTRLLILNNPCNPTGRLYTETELDEIFSVLQENSHVYVLVDEVYEWLSYTPGFMHAGAWEGITDRLITVSGFSKAFAMSGWRVGYMVAHQKLIQQSKSYQQITLSGVPLFTQRAALQAMQLKDTLLPPVIDGLKRSREVAATHLRQATDLAWFEPQAGFYYFVDVAAYIGRMTPDGRAIRTAADLSGYLMAHHRVQVFTGDIFGQINHLRLSFALDTETVDAGFARVVAGLHALE